MPKKRTIPTPAPLRYGSVCSGIEAVSLAWQPLGFTPAWFAEIDPFPCAVLSHHYPDVPNLGDMTQIARCIRAGTVPAPDMLVGRAGSPVTANCAGHGGALRGVARRAAAARVDAKPVIADFR